MNYRNVSVPARPVSGTLAATARNFAQSVALAGAFVITTGTMALAQQQPAPAAKPAPANKPPAKPAPAAPAPVPEAQQPAPSQAQGEQQQQQPQLNFSPWTKLCHKLEDNDPKAKEVCFTGKEARIESGVLIVAAVLIEPEGEGKKILRVTLPLGMQLANGTRVIVDSNQPMTAPYVLCVTVGCFADYEANADLIAKMKKGQELSVQAINSTGQTITLTLPLSDFAKAYDSPPTDPKVFEAQQKKLQEELQRRADEARKQLEQQQGQPQSSNAAPQAPQQAVPGAR
jgi:invasion protein IalB